VSNEERTAAFYVRTDEEETMTMRSLALTGCAMLCLATPDTGAAAQKAIYESEPKTVTATIDAIDQSTRIVTLKTEAGTRLHVTAPDEMEGFNRLRIGDIVTAKYFEAIAIRVAPPGSPPPGGTPTTSIRRKDDVPGSETMRMRTVRATVTGVNAAAPSVSVKGDDGRERELAVTDPSQLAALKAGDAIDLTFYESRLISVERPRK
jgi:hypothetical protein